MPGHRARGCLRKRTCKICSKRHPTGLHQENFQFKHKKNPDDDSKNETVNSTIIMATKSDSSAVPTRMFEDDSFESMPIVPVILKSPNAEIVTYAMLDNCCTGTFVLEEL